MMDTPVRRIRWRLVRMATGKCSKNERLVHWRTIARLALDEYERELSQLESLNSVKADPALEVPIA
jgi:hypothetical protein